MADQLPSRCKAADIDLNVRRMRLPDDLNNQYGDLLGQAVDVMHTVISGGIANEDENRQVGHYWLRDSSEAAPAEYRRDITDANSKIHAFCAEVRGQYDHIVWCVIGGSGLGPQMIIDALVQPGTGPQFLFFDNTDPSGFDRTFQQLGTGEARQSSLGTIAGRCRVEERRHEGNPQRDAGRRVAVRRTQCRLRSARRRRHETGKRAESTGGLLEEPVSHLGLGRRTDFDLLGCGPIGRGVGGGRLRGSFSREPGKSIRQHPAATSRRMPRCSWRRHGITQSRRSALKNMVVLPYDDRLITLSKYLQQLLMESLGKEGKGISVFGNKGSTDQHSFVQQLREGYRDFFVAFLETRVPTADWIVEPECRPVEGEVAAENVTAGDYLAAFQTGTEQALADVDRLSLRISINRLNAGTLGGLVALFERAVTYYAGMIGINAYHQPGVEAGKNAADQVLDVQRRLVSTLHATAESPTPTELAEQLDAPVEWIESLLDRLRATGRI